MCTVLTFAFGHCEELEIWEGKDLATSSEVYLFFLGTTAYIETYLELSQSFVECCRFGTLYI